MQLRISDGFYEREEHRRYLLKYTALSPQACNAIFRLLQGRFRFTIGFLNRYLQDRNGNWKRVLEQMQSVDPNSTVSALQTQLMRLGNSRVSRIQQEGHEASVMEVVKYSVFHRLVGRRNFTWGWPVQRDALRVGFAPLKEVTNNESGVASAENSEPLSILAVLRAWYGGSASRLCREVASTMVQLHHGHSARGFGVEVCIPSILEGIFDGRKDVEAHPLFQGVADLPEWFRGPAVLTTVFVDRAGNLARCLPAVDGSLGGAPRRRGRIQSWWTG